MCTWRISRLCVSAPIPSSHIILDELLDNKPDLQKTSLELAQVLPGWFGGVTLQSWFDHLPTNDDLSHSRSWKFAAA